MKRIRAHDAANFTNFAGEIEEFDTKGLINLTHNDDAFATMLLLSQISANRDEIVRPLSGTEYYQLREKLSHSSLHTAGALIGMDMSEVRHTLDVSEEEAYRICVLLNRVMPFSYALERFGQVGIEIVTVDEKGYPKRLIERLNEKAPPMLYAYGSLALAETTCIALIGNSSARLDVVECAVKIIDMAVKAGLTVVTGGENGFGRLVERETIKRNGYVISFLAESLAERVEQADLADAMEGGHVLMLSAIHPDARYTVSHALERNKYIYALARAAMIISCEKGRGVAWDGACSALRNRYCDKVYTWNHAALHGNRELIARGAALFTRAEELQLAEMKRVWEAPSFEQTSMF